MNKIIPLNLNKLLNILRESELVTEFEQLRDELHLQTDLYLQHASAYALTPELLAELVENLMPQLVAELDGLSLGEDYPHQRLMAFTSLILGDEEHRTAHAQFFEFLSQNANRIFDSSHNFNEAFCRLYGIAEVAAQIQSRQTPPEAVALIAEQDFSDFTVQKCIQEGYITENMLNYLDADQMALDARPDYPDMQIYSSHFPRFNGTWVMT